MATRAAKLALRGKALSDTGTEIGIVNNADATAITVDSSEKVGIGTSSPSSKLHISGTNDNNLIIQNSTYQGSGQNTEAAIRFKVTASADAERAKAGIHFKNDGSAFGRGDLHFAVDSNDDNGNVDIADSKMVITHEGNVGIGTASPHSKLTTESATGTNIVAKSTNGNGGYYNYQGLASDGTQTFGVNHNGTIFTTSGLAVGGTGAANTLDDYEEGTWTPVVQGAAGNPSSISWSTAPSGRYTKIGRQVTISFYLHINVATGGSGNFQLHGVPFTGASGNGGFSGAVSLYYGDASLSDPVLKIDTSYLSIICASGAGGYFSNVTWASAQLSAFANNTAMAGTVTYFV